MRHPGATVFFYNFNTNTQQVTHLFLSPRLVLGLARIGRWSCTLKINRENLRKKVEINQCPYTISIVNNTKTANYLLRGKKQ